METIAAELASQYLASLAMLENAVKACPESLWRDPAYKNRFWHVAYHVLFFTHLYLAADLGTYHPWENHRTDAELLGPKPWAPHEQLAPVEPYTPAEILAFLAFIRAEVASVLPGLDLAAPSGFDWLPMRKLELQLYNIRHLMLHTGELSDRLGSAYGLDMPWVSRLPV